MPTHLDQRSIVSVLAVDIVNSTRHVARADPDAVQEFLDHCFQRIEDVVRDAGGTIISFTGDGALTVFGWPNGLDDHADKACIAACAMQRAFIETDAPDEGRVGVRIGIHSGLVGLRRIDFGSGSRLDIVGAAVHFAAALEKAAPRGGILISSETRALCRCEIEADPHPAPPVFHESGGQAFLLREARAAAEPTSVFAARYRLPLVGREDDLRRLRELPLSTGGQGVVAAIIGEPGIGKSRLVAELAAGAEAAGERVIVCFSDPLKRTAPYEAFRSVLLRRLPADEQEAASKVEVLLADVGENVRAAVAAALFPSAATREKMRTGLATYDETVRALATLYTSLAGGQSTLLIIEDAHWTDSESRLCFEFLARPSSGFTGLLVFTGRPEATPYLSRLATHVLALEPLAAESMRQIAAQLDEDDQLPEPLRELVIERAEGVPLTLEQYIESARHLALSGESEMPLGVESLIHARVNRLSPHLRDIIQALGILGEKAEFDIAAETVDIGDNSFREGVRELEALAFLHAGSLQAIRFRHALLADACRTMLTRRRSEALHAAALRAIERRHRDDPGQFGRIAHHAVHAGDDLLALDYYWRAGRHARRQAARKSMKLIFEQAMQATERIGPKADARFADFVLLVFDSMHQIGELKRMMPLLLRTITLTRLADQPEKVCVALSHLGMAHWLDGLYEAGVPYAEEALEIATRLGRLPLIHYAQHTLAALLHMIGHVDRAIELMSELCRMFDGPTRAIRLGGVEVPGSLSRGFLAEFLVEVGRYQDAVEAGLAALEIAQAEREPFSEVMARIGLGEAYLFSCENQRAVDCLLPAKQQLEHYGFWPSDPTVCGHLATALARCGRGKEALEVSQKVFDLDRVTTPRAMHTLWAGHAEARWAALGAPDALEAVDHTVRLARERGAFCRLVQALGLRARLLSEIDPDDLRILRDRQEQAALCARFGLVAWEPSANDAQSARASQPSSG